MSLDNMEPKKQKEVLEMIAADMVSDSKEIDGHPFNGKAMGKYFGYQMAAILAIAKINYSMMEDIERLENEIKRLSAGPVQYRGVKK